MVIRALQRGVARPRGWAIWGLSAGLRSYVISVIAVAAGVTGFTVWRAVWRPDNLLLFAILAVFGAAAMELTRRITEPAGFIKDVHGIWHIPIALLLPPVYCLAAPIITYTLLQLRTHRTIAHRQVFSAATSALSLGAASLTFQALRAHASMPPLWLAAAAGTAVVWSAANTGLIMSAVWLSDRTFNVRALVLSREPLLNDGCEIATGVLIAGAIARPGAILLIPALPLVITLQRSFRHAQLRSEARLDADTGLLTSAAWRAEAAVHLAHARRTGDPVAVALTDVDHSRAITVAHGWQAGDAVLAMAASTLRAGLRESDVIGRMSGQMCAIFLPSTTAAEALQVAERLRRSLAAQTVPTPEGTPPVHVTISMGIAAAAQPGTQDLADLLLAADSALSQAKESGRDRVCLSSPGPADQQPDRDAAGPVRGLEDIADMRRELGEQLSNWRKRASMTQQELAKITGFSRSTVANAETGQGGAAAFWAAADRAVRAAGSLAAGWTRIEAANAAARRRRDRRAWVARAETAGPSVAAGIPENGAMAIQDSACPNCGEPLTVTTQVIATVIPQSAADPAGPLP
jgi:diguanylate cyclase (GGDEF)-like protein